MDNLIDLNLAFITNIRGPQLLIIVLVIFLLFGGSKRLPEMARGFGKAIKEFRKSASEVEKDFRSAMEETPVQKTSPEATTSIPPSSKDKA